MTEKCAFCGREESEFLPVVLSSNGLAICSQCIEECNNVLQSRAEEIANNSSEAQPLLTPSQIKQKLDDFVVGHDEAKKVLSVAVYNHYKRINSQVEDDGVELEKSNVLMFGSTGSGKTLLAKTLARVLDVPFAMADATTLTEAGYVGDDVENILLKLIQAADYDIEKAERGIIYIDEVDKIARKTSNVSITRDVSGEGVQQALLKIIESTVASVPAKGGRKHPNGDMISIDTTNILFICGGAFVGLDKILSKRLTNGSLGFGNTIATAVDVDGNMLAHDIQPQDLIKYGLIPEFVGRLPICVGLESLNEEALIKILTQPKNSIVKQYQKLLKLDDIDLQFSDEALRAVAQKSIELKTGARGLRAIVENIMVDSMYMVPDDKAIKQIVINKQCVESDGKPDIIRKKAI